MDSVEVGIGQGQGQGAHIEPDLGQSAAHVDGGHEPAPMTSPMPAAVSSSSFPTAAHTGNAPAGPCCEDSSACIQNKHPAGVSTRAPRAA